MKVTRLSVWMVVIVVGAAGVSAERVLNPQRAEGAEVITAPLVTLAVDCADYLMAGYNTSGVYEIYPFTCTCGRSVLVWCDMETDSGGWTVLLNRQNQTQQIDFNRTWNDYKEGFGSLNGEYWLGNEIVHAMTNSRRYTLRLDLTDATGGSNYATIDDVTVTSETDRYRVQGMSMVHSSSLPYQCLSDTYYEEFTTKDRDNDRENDNCAITHGGGWWYSSCSSFNPTVAFSGDSMPIMCGYRRTNVTRLQIKLRPTFCDASVKTIKLGENSCGCSDLP